MAEKTHDQELDRLLKSVHPDEARGIVKAVTEMVMGRLKDGYVERVVSESVDDMQQALGYTDAVLGAVEDLARQTGDSSEDVLLKALALYEAAIDARKKGQRLVLVGGDYQFIREIVGFEKEAPRPKEVAAR